MPLLRTLLFKKDKIVLSHIIPLAHPFAAIAGDPYDRKLRCVATILKAAIDSFQDNDTNKRVYRKQANGKYKLVWKESE